MLYSRIDGHFRVSSLEVICTTVKCLITYEAEEKEQPEKTIDQSWSVCVSYSE